MISTAFPYKKQRRRVLDREMAYVEVGEGDPTKNSRQWFDAVSTCALGNLAATIRWGWRLPTARQPDQSTRE